MSAARPELDPVIHAPARLKIAAALASVESAEFPALRELTGVSDSVLSKHLKQLEEAGYVKLHKVAADGHIRTRVSLTKAGRRAFAAHVAALQELAQAALPQPAGVVRARVSFA